MRTVGICFSKSLEGTNPLGHIDVKLPVYLRFLELLKNKGWNVYVFTRKTYQGKGIFNGAWKFTDGKFEIVDHSIKADVVYDRTAGVSFPPEGDESIVWVNRIDFKKLAWDKWLARHEIGEYMPQTALAETQKDLYKALAKIDSPWVVLKPFNGLKGIGLFIGPKEEAKNFIFPKNYSKYIVQEFVDTSGGIPGVTRGLHDLRVAIVNGEVVWSHVRVPPEGSYKANAAGGGELTEIDLEKIPKNVLSIVGEVTKKFIVKYDDPIYSIDFGIGKSGKPYIFEINDQIGFPKWGMKNRDNFLENLIRNFDSKLSDNI